MIRRISACLLCLVLLASLCAVWASEETTEPEDHSWQSVRGRTMTHSVAGADNESTNITVEMEGLPGFFTGLVLGAALGAAIASVSVIACSYMINRKRKNK